MAGFDAFISYSRTDAAAVRSVAEALRARGLSPFLDTWHLAPGKSWPELLEQNLVNCKSVVAMVGPRGLGGWQKREIYKALDRQVGEDMPVIPVLLPGTEDPALGFLALNTWVDLRGGLDDDAALDILAKAVRGEPPGPIVRDARAEICPYRGLEPFREEDAPFFFGRDSFTELLLDKIAEHDLIAVVGASGSGKSSVVRAGLVPRLRRAKDTVWDIATVVPGAEPLEALVRALDPPGPDMSLTAARAHVNAAAGMLRAGTVTLSQLVGDVIAAQPGTDRLLLVVDQFEELVTLCAGEADRNAFIELLLEATGKGAALSVVVTLRSDFYTEFVRRRDLADRMQDGIVNIGPLSRTVPRDAPEGALSELEQTVRLPAREVGLGFEDGLVQRILNDVGNEPGKLPLLEYLLTELWRRRRAGKLTHEAYDALGGVAGAIAQRAEEAFTSLDADAKAAARRLFLSLVRPGEGQHDTRARALFPDDPQAAAVARHFSDAKVRLLVTGEDAVDGRTVEVSHEALIHNWTTLRRWVDMNRETLRIRERVADRMAQWEANGRHPDLLLPGGLELEEGRRLLADAGDVPVGEVRPFIEESIAAHTVYKRRRAQVRFWTVAGSIAAVVVMAVLTGTTVWQYYEALGAKEDAEKAELRAVDALLEAEIAKDAAVEAGELAEHARRQAVRAQQDAEAASVEALLQKVRAEAEVRKAQALLIEAATSQARFRAQQARALSRQGDHAAALMVAMDGMPQARPEGEFAANPDLILDKVPDLPQALADALRALRIRHVWRHARDARFIDLDVTRDGRVMAIGYAGRIVLRDMASGRELQVLAASAPGDGAAEDGASDDDVDRPDAARFAMGPVFSPDGGFVAAATRAETVKVWEVATGKLHAEFAVGGARVGSLAFSRDGSRLLATDGDNQIVLWDLASRRELWRVRHSEERDRRPALRLTGAMFLGDGTRVLASSRQKWQVRRAGDGAIVSDVKANGERVLPHPGGDEILSLTYLRVYDLASGRRLDSLDGKRGRDTTAAYAPDGSSFAVALQDARIKVFDRRRRVLRELKGHGTGVISLAFSPDSARILALGQDGDIRIWDVETGDLVLRLGEQRPYSNVARPRPNMRAFMTGDGAHIVAVSQRGTIRVWRADAPLGQRVFTEPRRTVSALALSRDGAELVTYTGQDLRVRDTLTGAEKIDLFKERGSFQSGPVAHAGEKLAFLGKSTRGLLLDTATGETRPPLTHDERIRAARFARDGALLMTMTATGIRIWESESLRQKAEWLSEGDRFYRADISADGRSVVMISGQGISKRQIWLWRPDEGPARRLKTLVFGARDVRIAPDGSFLTVLGISPARGITLIDPAEERILRELPNDGNAVTSMAISRDGRRIAAGFRHGEMWIYDSSTGEIVDRMAGHKGQLLASDFSGDGRFVATSAADGTVMVWRHYRDTDKLYRAAEEALDDIEPLTAAQACALYLKVLGCS